MDKDITELVASAQTAELTPELTSTLISLIDLTSLAETDSSASIAKLCEKAVTPPVSVAAVCVYPRFVNQAKALLASTSVKIATVANFPQGNASQAMVIAEIAQAVADGADEIDVVTNYRAYQENRSETLVEFLTACKQACQAARLKVILETGALTAAQIVKASEDAIAAGANFIKTSTGKIAIGATLEAAASMLLTIKASGKTVGFKASGGIRTPEQAASYLKLAELILGKDYLSPQTLRFGASGLLDALLTNSNQPSAY